MKKKVSVSYLFFLLPLLFFTLIAYANQVEDIWFLFSHGRYVLEYGIPHTDFLTIHQNLHFVMQQWGFSVLLYFFYQHIGSMGVFFFLGIMNFFIVYFLYRLCMVISSNNYYYSCLIASVIDVLLELAFIIPRPQIMSLLIFIIVLFLLERYHKNKNDRGVFFFPLLSIILINIHASMWPMLFVFSLPFVVEYIILFIRKKENKIFFLIFTLFLSFLCGFLNPYGIEAMTYSFHSYGIDIANQLIIEMHSFSLFTSDYSLLINSLFILSIIIANVVFIILNYKKYPIHYYFLFLGFSFMAFLNIRNCSFLIIGTMPFFVTGFRHLVEKKIPISYFVVPICGILSIVFFQYYRGFYEIRNVEVDKIADYLKKEKTSTIRLYTGFNEGSYLEYQGYSVYMDSRMEVFLKKNNHKEDILEEYYQLLMGTIDYEQFIQKYHFNYLVVPKNTLFSHYLEEHDYDVVCREKNILLFKKR